MENQIKYWSIKNEADMETADIFLYGVITSDKWEDSDVCALDFAKDLQSLGGKAVNLHINSPGGNVFEAQAIYNQLKAYSGAVNTIIDGMCASAATVVALAGDKICMPKNGIFMIHNPSVGFVGMIDQETIDKIGNMLSATKQTIVNIYMKKCKNLSEVQVKHLMDGETWMTADEAFNYGFIDSIVDDMADIENATYLDCVAYANSNYAKSPYLCDNGAVNQCKIDNEPDTEEVKNVDNKSWLEDLKNIFKINNDVESAVKAERERVIALEKLRNGNEAIDKIVDIALEKGNTASDIEEFVNAIADIQPKNDGIEEIKAIVTDQKNSGAENVTPSIEEPTDEIKSANDVDRLVNMMSDYVKSQKK